MVVIITTMNSADLIKEREKAGWTLRGVKGSHHIYTHPTRGGHLSVPHPKKDLGAGLAQQAAPTGRFALKGGYRP